MDSRLSQTRVIAINRIFKLCCDSLFTLTEADELGGKDKDREVREGAWVLVSEVHEACNKKQPEALSS